MQEALVLFSYKNERGNEQGDARNLSISLVDGLPSFLFFFFFFFLLFPETYRAIRRAENGERRRDRLVDRYPFALV